MSPHLHLEQPLLEGEESVGVPVLQQPGVDHPALVHPQGDNQVLCTHAHNMP